jgi:hypothetical protein
MDAFDQIMIAIDADRNAATGAIGGDYFLWLYGFSTTYRFLRWNSSNAQDPQLIFSPTISVNYASGTATMVLSTHDIGGTGSFAFRVITYKVNLRGNVLASDFAPNGPPSAVAGFTYALTTQQAANPTSRTRAIRLGYPSSGSAGIRAGRPFTVSVPVGTNASSVRVACSATLGGRRFRLTARYSSGFALCSGNMPKDTVRKRLIGTVRASVSGAEAARAFNFNVMP